MASNTAPGHPHGHGLMAPPVLGRPHYPFAKAFLVMGSVCGFMGGMAYANVWTRLLGWLIVWSFSMAIIFGLLSMFIGWLIDLVRNRRHRTP